MVHEKYSDSIQKAIDLPTEDFEFYTELSKANLKNNEESIRELEEDFYLSHPEVEKSHLSAVFDQTRPKLKNNLGLVQFTKNYGGEKSDFFFPWLISTWNSPSLALEGAFGYGVDLLGEFRKIPDSDPMNFFVKNDPTFVYNREREIYMANLVHSSRQNASFENKSVVVDLGAGRMAWLRHTGFAALPILQKIYAFDSDPSINLGEGFCNKNGVVFKTLDIKDALSEIAPESIDLILMAGVASYMSTEVLYHTIETIHSKLKTGGALFFDLQLDCPYLRRSMEVFGWPKINLLPLGQTIDYVEKIKSDLYDKKLMFSPVYKFDGLNKIASAVMLTMTKL